MKNDSGTTSPQLQTGWLSLLQDHKKEIMDRILFFKKGPEFMSVGQELIYFFERLFHSDFIKLGRIFREVKIPVPERHHANLKNIDLVMLGLNEEHNMAEVGCLKPISDRHAYKTDKLDVHCWLIP